MNKLDKVILLFYIFLAFSYGTFIFTSSDGLENDLLKPFFPEKTIEFEISRLADVNIEKIFNVMADIENFPNVLPNNVNYVKILNQTENVIVAEEEFVEAGIKIKLLARHTITPYNEHIIEIIDGAAKGTKIIQSFESVDSKTNLITKVHLKLSGLASLVAFIPESNLIHALNTVISHFVDYAKYDLYEQQVNSLYQEILLRSVDNEGLVHYSTLLRTGQITEDELRIILLNSEEKSLMQEKTNNELSSEIKRIPSELASNQKSIDFTYSIQKIDVGEFPIGITVNSNTNMIYVSNNLSNTVSVINGTSGILENTIIVGNGPSGIDVNPVTNMIYVPNYYSHSLSVINGTTNTVLQEISLADAPWGVSVNPLTNTIYVTNYFANVVTIINGENLSLETVPVDSPWGIDVNPETNKVYVANRNTMNISIIDGDTNKVETFPVDSNPINISPTIVSVNHYVNMIYVSNTSNVINIINGSNNIPTNSIQVGQSIIGMEVDHDRNILYLVDNSLDSLLVVNINTGNVIGSIDVGKYPLMIAYNEKTGFLYVSNEYSNSISVIKPEF